MRYTRVQVDSDSSWALPVRHKQGTQLVVELWAITGTGEEFLVAISQLEKILFTLTLRNLLLSPEGSPCKRRKRTLDEKYSKSKRLRPAPKDFLVSDAPKVESLAWETSNCFNLPDSSFPAIEDHRIMISSPDKFCEEEIQLSNWLCEEQKREDPPMTPNPGHLFPEFTTSTPTGQLNNICPGWEYWDEVPRILFDNSIQMGTPTSKMG